MECTIGKGLGSKTHKSIYPAFCRIKLLISLINMYYVIIDSPFFIPDSL